MEIAQITFDAGEAAKAVLRSAGFEVGDQRYTTREATFSASKGQDTIHFRVAVEALVDDNFYLSIECPEFATSPLDIGLLYASPEFVVRWFHRGHLPLFVRSALCGALGYAICY